MYVVYSLQSEKEPARYYVGLTTDLPQRITAHNAGGSTHTFKCRPWKILVAVHFEDEKKARAFEKYLKSGSGRTFAKRHF